MYQAYAVVEMEYQRREEGYLALGEYMGGANAAKSRFAFTAPVVMRYFPNVSPELELMAQLAGGHILAVHSHVACSLVVSIIQHRWHHPI